MQQFLKSLGYSIAGISIFIKTERHAKVHLAATTLVLAVGVFLELSKTDWLWITLAVSVVWIAEMVNTAIEKLCDKVSPERSPEIKMVKDVSAGFVLIASAFAILVGATIMLPQILLWFA